jgi:hypothetical protein
VAFETVASIISDAAKQLGLVTSDIADPFSSTDQNVVQMLALLKSAGRTLAKKYAWSQLLSQWELTTVNGTSLYDLPGNFSRFVDQTGWNTSTRLPLGTVSPQQAQQVQVSTTVGMLWQSFRLIGGQLELIPSPTATQSLTLNYYSSTWVQLSDGGMISLYGPFWDRPAAADDVVRFDSELMIAALKLAFLGEKGFDTGKAADDFAEQLAATLEADRPAPVLRLGGCASPEGRLINGANVPDTGVGS